MGFDAATLQHLEDALSESFRYHSALDSFLLRSGLSSSRLADSRKLAEERASGRFEKAPKRFVAQIVLQDLGSMGDEGDRIIAAMVTSLHQMTFPDATEVARSAIQALQTKIKSDKEVRAEQREAVQRGAAVQKRKDERAREVARAARTRQRDTLGDRFVGLMSETNAQARGYLFETFLNDLFEFEGLDPRRSFRLVGEQIDGSFNWRSRTHLVEAKWTQAPAAGLEFGAFNYKLEGKTVDTRGLFISVNGYSMDAIKGANSKGALKFVCIDGAHLMRALSSDDGLVPILERIWRHADETGETYLSAPKI